MSYIASNSFGAHHGTPQHGFFGFGAPTPTKIADAVVTDFLGGKLWTFTAKALPIRVAVFCSRQVAASNAFDLLLFAHGLLTGCPRPKQLPSGFITDAPFNFGRIVDAAQRPLVLVVPLLDWGSPGGERAFGAAHRRWHALASPRILNAVLDEVLVEVRRVLGGVTRALRNLMIAGHSRAYDFLEPLANRRTDSQLRQGALARLSHVWAFDTTYGGEVGRWLDWLKIDPKLQVAFFYRLGTPTEAIGERFYTARGPRFAVSRVGETHCAVPGTRLPALLQSSAPRSTPLQGFHRTSM